MAETKKRTASPALASMTPVAFAKILAELKDLYDALDEASTGPASAFKKIKKQGINIDALRLVRKLKALDSPAKIQAFLADFDKMRELVGFDAQQQLFDEDKTKPQKDAETAESAKIVDIKSGAKAVVKAAKEAAKGVPKPPKNTPAVKVPKGAVTVPAPAEVKPVSRAALFDTDDSDTPDASAAEGAHSAGYQSGFAGDIYKNPHAIGHELRDPWHKGWVDGAEKLADSTGQQASA